MSKGFTLMELLITVAIMGILSTVGVGAFMSSFGKARDAQRKQDLGTLSKALEAYSNDFEEYPTSNGSGLIEVCNPNNLGNSSPCNWGEAFVVVKNGQTINYLDKMPMDPLTTSEYYYEKETDGSYSLYAHFENTQDPWYSAWGINCGSLECNYKLTPHGPEKQ